MAALLTCSAIALAVGGCSDDSASARGTPSRGGELARAPGEELKFGECRWGRIVINGKRFEKDVVIDRDAVRERKKKPSKKYRARFGHTPLSVDEQIPWDCKELVVGIGFQSRLPVMNEVKAEAARRNVKLILLPTPRAVDYFKSHQEGRNAIFHLTC